MPDAVRDCFPDAPEKCLLCPGLTTAARNSAASFEALGRISVDARVPIQRGRDVQLAAVAQVLGVTVTEVAQAHRRAVVNIARLLHYSCSEGVKVSRYVLPSRRFRWLLPRQRGVEAVMYWCGSSSPFADFVPGVVAEELGVTPVTPE